MINSLYNTLGKLQNVLIFWIFNFMIFQNSIVAMNQIKPTLAQSGSNVYSQFGEDGVISKIFETIGVESKVCIEFGAWDGFHLSNTANLWGNQGWQAILIEADPARCTQMYHNIANYKSVTGICEKVGIGKQDSLEAILTRYNIDNKKIDLLSIDIDSDDYYIFQSLSALKPRVVICEYNPTMPAHLDIYQEFGRYMGCSVGALMRIAKEKGYELVALTTCNCFFVLNDEFIKFKDYETSLENIRIDRYLRYVITDYQGQYAIVAAKNFIEPYGLQGPIPYGIFGNFHRIFK